MHSKPSHYTGWLSSNHLLYLGTKDCISQEGRSDWLTWVICSPSVHGPMIGSFIKPCSTNRDGTVTKRQKGSWTDKQGNFSTLHVSSTSNCNDLTKSLFCDFYFSGVHLPLWYQCPLILWGTLSAFIWCEWTSRFGWETLSRPIG